MIAARRIAIVTPWFGAELKGGAEQQAFQLATRLGQRGHELDVLTTCCRSFFDDWGTNHLPHGAATVERITVRRFPVDTRDRESFDRLNAELLAIPRDRLVPGVSPIPEERAKAWTRENINSRALQDYLADRKEDYDNFIFLPYLYGTTINGLPPVSERAWLQPCLHDEVYAYLPDIADMFYKPEGLLMISEGEREIASRLFGPAIVAKSAVTGAGVEFERLDRNISDHLPGALQQTPFVLCLGRRDRGKGTDLLARAFGDFRKHAPSTHLALVLAGSGEADYADPANGIIDLGVVSESVKVSLLHSCRALCQPSTNESFSRVLFEAWHCGKPALVHRDCPATRLALETCKGGWTAGSIEEWAKMLAVIDSATESRLADFGSQGRTFAQEVADWDSVIGKYEQVLAVSDDAVPRRKAAKPQRAVHQLLPNIAYGDAISSEALFIRNELRSLGFASEIFARHVDPRLSDESIPIASIAAREDDALIYHHSIGSEVTALAVRHSGPKCLIYHNITPPQFFTPFRPTFAALLRDGREHMWRLARAFPVSAGDSKFNAAELEIFGFKSPSVLPLPVDPEIWRNRPDPGLMFRLQDGTRNVVFVGRVAPNKGQHQLVEAFAQYRELEDARLILVGSFGQEDPYCRYVKRRIGELGLERHVWLVGQSSIEELHAYYRTADLFWSMSEHEGFGVPLVEAMWFDIPILAYRSTAVPETLGDAGIMFDSKENLGALAGTAHQLASDSAARGDVLRNQRRRRLQYSPAVVRTALYALIDRLVAENGPAAFPAGIGAAAVAS